MQSFTLLSTYPTSITTAAALHRDSQETIHKRKGRSLLLHSFVLISLKHEKKEHFSPLSFYFLFHTLSPQTTTRQAQTLFSSLLPIICSLPGHVTLSSKAKIFAEKRRSTTTMCRRLPTAFITTPAGSPEQENEQTLDRGKWKGEEKRVGKERQHHCRVVNTSERAINIANPLWERAALSLSLWYEAGWREKEETSHQTSPLVWRTEGGAWIPAVSLKPCNNNNNNRKFLGLFWAVTGAKGNNGFKPSPSFHSKTSVSRSLLFQSRASRTLLWKQKTIIIYNLISSHVNKLGPRYFGKLIEDVQTQFSWDAPKPVSSLTIK